MPDEATWFQRTYDAGARAPRREPGVTEIIDAEVIDEPGSALEVRQAGGLFRTEDPAEFLAKATETATMLADVVRKQKLVVTIGKSEHVKVEGWAMLGSLLGVQGICVWTRKLEDGWEARVEARTLSGQVVGAAEAECLRSEKTWADRDDYALRSMAQTRATSKALRQPLGFVMTMAGFNPTPAEEMPTESRERSVAYASENEVTRMLELAAKVDAHDKAAEAIAKHRDGHDGRVESAWLKRQVANLEKKLPADADLPEDPEAIPF